MFTGILGQILQVVWTNTGQLASLKNPASLVPIISRELFPNH